MQIKVIGLTATILVALSISGAMPVVAHHSHAMYESNAPIQLEGTVKEYIWANPHVWIYVEIPDENGQPVEWILESQAPASLARQGWSPQSMKAGDLVTVTIGPLKDGTSGGLLGAVVFSDGSALTTTALDNNTDLTDAQVFGIE